MAKISANWKQEFHTFLRVLRDTVFQRAQAERRLRLAAVPMEALSLYSKMVRIFAVCAVIVILILKEPWEKPYPTSLLWLSLNGFAVLAYGFFAFWPDGLPLLRPLNRKMWVDTLCISLLLVGLGEAHSPMAVLYALPVVEAAHGLDDARFRRAALFIPGAVVMTMLTSFILELSYSPGVTLQAPLQTTHGVVMGGFVLTAVVLGLATLRVYRVAYRVELGLAEERAHEAEEAAFRVRALHEGIRSGVCVLEVREDGHGDGKILYWNETHERLFAPRDAQQAKDAGLPCYKVFHNVDRPCQWCKLPWRAVRSSADGLPTAYKIDTEKFRRQLHRGGNWTISSQLEASRDPPGLPRLHLYLINYGALIEDDLVTAVVESVSEITDAVLEMPFLGWGQSDGKELPPLRILDRQRRVIGMNRAMEQRCGEPRESLLGKPCYEALRQDGGIRFCEGCPAETAIANGCTTRGVSSIGGRHALLTCVPFSGPDGGTRGVFEFVDDIGELMLVLEGIRDLNDLADPVEVTYKGLEKMRRLAKAWRCVLLTADPTEMVVVRGDSTAPRDTAYEFPLEDWSILRPALERGEIAQTEDACQESGIPAVMRRFARKHKIGSVVFLPVSKGPGPMIIIAIEQRVEDEALSHETMGFCRILAEGIAGALERASHQCRAERLAAQRKMLIEAIQDTYDVLHVELALKSLIAHCPDILSPAGEAAGISVYSITYPAHGVTRTADLAPADIVMLFEIGTGDPEFRARMKGKWNAKRHIIPMKATLSMFVTQDITEFSVPACSPHVARARKPLLLEDTRSGLLVPLVYRDRVVGCIVAESKRADAQAAFPEDRREPLRLIGMLAGLLIGRYRLVADSIASITHHYRLVRDLAALAVRYNDVRDQPEGADLLKEILALAEDCEEELRVSLRAWQLMTGAVPDLGLETCDILEVVEAARSRLARVGGNALDVSVQPEVWQLKVRCNGAVLRSVMFELLSNAWRHGTPTDQRLTIQLARCERQVSIRLENPIQTPIPKNVLERVFEPYYSYSTRALSHGEADASQTGLGLFQAQILIEAYRGYIGLDTDGVRCFAIEMRLPSTEAGGALSPLT